MLHDIRITVLMSKKVTLDVMEKICTLFIGETFLYYKKIVSANLINSKESLSRKGWSILLRVDLEADKAKKIKSINLTYLERGISIVSTRLTSVKPTPINGKVQISVYAET